MDGLVLPAAPHKRFHSHILFWTFSLGKFGRKKRGLEKASGEKHVISSPPQLGVCEQKSYNLQTAHLEADCWPRCGFHQMLARCCGNQMFPQQQHSDRSEGVHATFTRAGSFAAATEEPMWGKKTVETTAKKRRDGKGKWSRWVVPLGS